MMDQSEENERKPLLASSNYDGTRSSFRGSPNAALSRYHDSHRAPQIPLGFGTVAAPLLCSGSDASGSWSRQSLADGEEDPMADRESNVIVAKRRAKVLLPIIVISYFFGYIPSMVIMNPYIYDRIAEEYDYEVNTSSQVPCVKDMDNITGNTSGKEIQEEIERRVSTLELYLHLTTYVPAILPIFLLGPLTDKFGRKAGLLFPICATLMKQIVYIIVLALRLPMQILFLAHAIEAVGGSFAAMLSAMFSVISDVTLPGQGRSGWIAVMEALQTLAASLCQVIVAQWMRQGYIHPLIFAVGFCCLAFFLTVFVFRETNQARPSNTNEELERQSKACQEDRNANQRPRLEWVDVCWKTVRNSVTLYTRDNNSSTLCKRRLCLAVFICTVAVNFSRTGVEALFQLKYPLCWPATKVYTFNGLRIFLSWVVILCALGVMQKLFRLADRHVAIVGVVSSTLSNAATSLSVNSVMIYEAAVVGVMTRSIIPMVRSILSSLVPYGHQGAMYSGLSCVESLGASVFSTASNRIYYSTLSSWAGLIFMIFACIMILALVLLVILNKMFARETTDRRRDPQPSGNIQQAAGDL